MLRGMNGRWTGWLVAGVFGRHAPALWRFPPAGVTTRPVPGAPRLPRGR
jgi:hypothetical protein